MEYYKITIDCFFKMCLIIQKIKCKIPIVLMGESGVGKTALIKFLANCIFEEELYILNVHAGI